MMRIRRPVPHRRKTPSSGGGSYPFCLVAGILAALLLTGAARAPNVPRDSHGRIERSTAAKNAFKRVNPCPSTGQSSGSCPGYVIDHVIPLKRGGADAPGNMQWQDTISAKAKDKVE